MGKKFFITGTDTEIGKTTISLGLITALKNTGHKVSAIKPVASGSTLVNGALRNDDALKLIDASNTQLDYDKVNPYCFEPPIAPHIAAQQTNTEINIETICKLAEEHKAQSDYCIVEGVGGWQVPLNDNETVEDLAKVLQLPVILVVGIRLGCINHALLTVQAIQDSGLSLAGWVANHCEPDTNYADEIVESLIQRINAPCIGVVEFLDDVNVELVSNQLDIASLV